jgi:hypothetical protein
MDAVILKKILIGALVGTSAMTGYSYLVSDNSHRQFREPVLLNKFMKRSGLPVQKESSKGWILHYTTGLLFATAYHKLWRFSRLQPSIKMGAVLGAVSGLVGIGVWKLLYNFYTHPPQTHERKYYKQLFAAHIIFGVFTTMGYRLTKKQK